MIISGDTSAERPSQDHDEAAIWGIDRPSPPLPQRDAQKVREVADDLKALYDKIDDAIQE